jgi:hypothetical protein
MPETPRTWTLPAKEPRCHCGHAKQTHIDGHGLCLSCKRPPCLGHRPRAVEVES